MPATSDSPKPASDRLDQFRLKAAEFRALAERAKDPVIADGYRRLAEGYESLAGCCNSPSGREKT